MDFSFSALILRSASNLRRKFDLLASYVWCLFQGLNLLVQNYEYKSILGYNISTFHYIIPHNNYIYYAMGHHATLVSFAWKNDNIAWFEEWAFLWHIFHRGTNVIEVIFVMTALSIKVPTSAIVVLVDTVVISQWWLFQALCCIKPSIHKIVSCKIKKNRLLKKCRNIVVSSIFFS